MPPLDLWSTSNRDLGGASHLQALVACMAARPGQPVLEIGIGHSSTPVLHAARRSEIVVSLESDPDWLESFRHAWADESHLFFEDTDQRIAELTSPVFLLGESRWGVVFIDDSPGAEYRAAHLRRFLSTADYVVMHDAEPEGNNHGPAQAVLSELKVPYVLWYNRYHPWTLVASLTRPIPLIP